MLIQLFACRKVLFNCGFCGELTSVIQSMWSNLRYIHINIV